MLEQVLSAFASGTGAMTITKAISAIGPEVVGGDVASSAGTSLPAAAPADSMQDLAIVVEQLNIANRSIGRDLRFQVDLDKGYAVILVLDRDTGELIRRIPPEKLAPYIRENGALKMRLYDEMV